MRVAAVDLGASSGRVAVVDLDTFGLEVVHRFSNAPMTDGDSLRWDWPRLMREVATGLEAAGDVSSIGVDTWGVDYGLLDSRGMLIAPPFSYRDARTNGWREIVDRIGVETIYRRTGIQMMALNTLIQLAVHDRGELDRARTLLMLPELVVYELTGMRTGERTSAGTSQMVDIRSQDWAPDLCDAIGVDPSILPPIERAGRQRGAWRGIPVHLVGGHDTASAVAALPDPAPGAAFVSSGTWSLVGAERDEPDTSDAALAANFSNEPSVFGGVRFLKNVIGLWMLEEVRREWNASVEDLLLAGAETPPGPSVDATDDRFIAPGSMEAEIRDAAGLKMTAGRPEVVRCILDSLAAATARVIGELEGFAGARVPAIHVVGGGCRIGVLNDLIEQACGAPVVAGPVEATALGNAMVQGIALGRFEDLAAARTFLAERGTPGR